MDVRVDVRVDAVMAQCWCNVGAMLVQCWCIVGAMLVQCRCDGGATWVQGGPGAPEGVARVGLASRARPVDRSVEHHVERNVDL